MNANQLHILQHALGCDQYGRADRKRRDEGDGCFEYYRNHYVHGETPDLAALVEAGFMTRRNGNELTGGDPCYHVTREGVAAMKEHSPQPPTLSRGQQRYRQFLRADLGLPFREYLTLKLYRHAHD